MPAADLSSPGASAYLACDLGAESGRVMRGVLHGGIVELEELHRFPNGPVRLQNSLRWDLLRIFEELKAGLAKAAAGDVPLASVSVDSWGLDYVLLGAGQPMLSLPYHYRDARSDAPYAAALKDPGREFIFAESGIQFMSVNTLYQLAAEQARSPQLLAAAECFLMVADYFHYLFCGVKAAEESLASTTQLYHPETRAWSARLGERFHIPAHLFPPLVASGTRLGPLLPEVSAETGLQGLQVVATCSHDTGAAVAAVPAEGEGWAYLSSGTWSLLGVELERPLLTPMARDLNFTNEAGFGGATRFLKNIVGLWLLQEARREWADAGESYSYSELALRALEAPPLRSLIDANDPRFLKPGGMLGKIAAYCRETGQPAPATPGEFTRCIYESLALLYARTLKEIEQATGRRIDRLHVVGGGSQSAILNQFTADATGRLVLAGPVEATALGNVLLQAVVHGRLASLAELRATVRRSVSITEHRPEAGADWSSARERLRTYVCGSRGSS